MSLHNRGMGKVLVCAIMCASFLSLLADTATINGNTWTYTISNGEASAGGGSSSSTAIPKSTEGAITIPSSLGGCPVTSIGDCAFIGCTNLTSVMIPNSVTNIGVAAFKGSSSLSHVMFPDNLKRIGSFAFEGCVSLREINLPIGLTHIASYSFYSCENISSVYLPDTVEYIGEWAFSYCDGIESISIPGRVTTIGASAFRGCRGLTNVHVGKQVTNIQENAFYYCINLTSFVVDDENPKYSSSNGLLLSKDGTRVILGVNGDVIIPDDVKVIGWESFKGCVGLRSVAILGRTQVEGYAFDGCKQLVRITIGEHVTSLSPGAFNDCGSIMEFSVNENNAQYSSINGLLLSKGGENLICGVNGDVNIPHGVRSVSYSAFNGCQGLTSVEIPPTVTNIGSRAFFGCVALTNVILNVGLMDIGEYAFCGCSSVKNIEFPDGLVTIGHTAFSGCSFLKEVVIPDSVVDVGGWSFQNCMHLENVYIGQNVDAINTHTFSGCSNLTMVTLPRDLKGIEACAFEGCVLLNGIEIPSPVTNIGEYAFGDCKKLSNVSMSSNVVNIGYGAFCRCTGLESVTIEDGITNIGDFAFAGCDSLASVLIPGSVKSVGAYAFSRCRSLNGVTFVDGITKIGTYAFRDCIRLTSVSIPSSVSSIGSSAFSGCSGIDSFFVADDNEAYKSVAGLLLTKDGETLMAGVNGDVTIPYGVTRIRPNAFRNHIGLKSVTIPNSVANIGNDAFSDCSGLDRVYLSVEHLDLLNNFPASAEVIQYKPSQTISFDVSDGVVCPVTQIVNYGMAYGNLPVPSRDGHAFLGWTWNDESITSNTVVMALDDHLIVAQWKVNEYTVSFDSVGGTPVEPITQNYATSITQPANPTRTGYTFDGWSPSVPTIMPASNTTCTARWQVNQYTVSFDSAGGTSVASITQDYETAITPPENPTRTGYTFTCWQPSLPKNMPASNATCTAQWEVNQYAVAFDANGGIVVPSSKMVTYDMEYGALPIPYLEFFTFEGWRLGGCAVTDSTKVSATANHTLVAQWRRYGARINSADVSGNRKLKELYPEDFARLTIIELSDGITELPEGFFDGCNEIVSIILPSTLVEFSIDDLPPKIRASLTYDADGFMIYNNWILDYKNRYAVEVAIPEGIVGVGCSAFSEMYYLETVTMPLSLRCIAKGAFEWCAEIQSFDFASGLRYVGPMAFSECSCLLRATFADGLEHIGTNAFYDCWQMLSVRIPASVTNVGDNAFAECNAIRGVTVPTHLKTMQEMFPSFADIESVEIAEGETNIMDDMFAGCVSLSGGATQTDMSMMPTTVTNVGARAFSGCRSLTAMVLPDSVIAIGESAFLGCSMLRNMTLSRNLTELPDYAFYGCSSLESMIVPESVVYIGNRFFCGSVSTAPDVVVNNALYYLGNAPEYHQDAYAAISGNMTTYYVEGSLGWNGRPTSPGPPKNKLWNGYKWESWTPIRFDVTFDANGGQFDLMGGSIWSEPQISDMPYALPSTEPVRPGWAFEGWWTEQAGGAQVRYTTIVTATRTHTLYAHWRSLGERMTVTFNGNGGTVAPETQDYVPGQTFGEFPVPTRRGYMPQGWWTEAVNGACITEATEVPAADMELFAHWQPIEYFVRFNANGGVGTMANQHFTYDVQEALATNVFLRAGFAFTGWATTPSGQVRYAENTVVANLEETHDSIVDLYAVWSGAGYSIRFDSNGGTGIMGNQTIAIGEMQNLWLCVFTRDDYVFAGWAISPTDAAAKKVTYRDGAAVKDLSTMNGAVVPLYAVWMEADRSVRITFDANGGSVSPDYWNCVIGTTVEAFPMPTRPGYGFDGWWTAVDGGLLQESLDYVAAPLTYYAHWILIPELITDEADAWIVGWLAAQFAKSGESAAEYRARFEQKFGNDPVGALTKATGKKDGRGNDMYVWQDYIAGTDPTDTNSVFTANVEMVDGLPVVTWEPKLSAGEEARRSYTIYGKTNLTDKAWHSPTNEASRFFKVGVEMR